MEVSYMAANFFWGGRGERDRERISSEDESINLNFQTETHSFFALGFLFCLVCLSDRVQHSFNPPRLSILPRLRSPKVD